jgi:hypothetical protein
MAKYFHALDSNFTELSKLYDDGVIDKVIFTNTLKNFDVENSILVEDETEEQKSELVKKINNKLAKIGD